MRLIWVPLVYVMGLLLRLENEPRVRKSPRRKSSPATSQRLSLSDNTYKKVVDNLHEVIFQLDPAGNILFINAAWTHLTGFTQSESLGKPFRGFFHPEDLYETENLVIKHPELQQYKFDMRVQTKSGEFRWLKAILHINRFPDMRIIDVTGVLSDVPDQPEVQLALNRRSEILDAIAFAAETLVKSENWEAELPAILPRVGQATAVNRVRVMKLQRMPDGSDLATHVAAWYKNSDDPLQHQPFELRFDPQLLQTSIFQSLRAGHPMVFNLNEIPEQYRPLFAPFNVRTFLVMPIRVAGTTWGYLALVETERDREWRQFEKEALEIAANILGATIQRQRADAATQRYARQLEERNQDLDLFTRMVAHDLKAPLHTIMSTAEMIRERYAESIPAEAQLRLQRIETRAKQTSDMVQQLLLLARATDTATLTGKMVNADWAWHEAFLRYEDAIEAKGIQLEVQSPLPMACGHRPWLVEIFANLLSNAITYMGKAIPTPIISVRAQLEPDDKVTYFVTDNGVGIPADQQEQLFKPYSRLDRTIAGHGLGLAIIKRMVTNMHGSVGVKSTEGQGSTFWFTLPACPPSEKEASTS